MIKQIGSLSVDVIPQAIVKLPVRDVASGSHLEITQGYDDLDVFEGASFKLDNQIEVAVRHYQGHPENTTTIYIDVRESEVPRITTLIRRILKDLHIPEKALQWERRLDPDL